MAAGRLHDAVWLASPATLWNRSAAYVSRLLGRSHASPTILRCGPCRKAVAGRGRDELIIVRGTVVFADVQIGRGPSQQGAAQELNGTQGPQWWGVQAGIVQERNLV